MTVDPVFRNRGEQTLGNYNWIDLAEGSGYVTFYPVSTIEETTENFTMLRTKRYGHTFEQTGIKTVGTITKEVDIDFDIKINKPSIINGNVVVNMPFRFGHENNNGTGDGYWIIKVRKYSGSTETDLGSTQSNAFNTVGGAGAYVWEYDVGAYMVDIDNASLKRGDILRITVEGWISSTNYGSTQIGFTYSPNDETTTWWTTENPTTTMTVDVPFKIDL